MVFLLVLLALARVLFPFLVHYKPEILQKISASIDRPIDISQMKADWSQINPLIELKNIVVFDETHHIPLLQIKNLKLKINILSSVLQRKLIVQDFTIEDSQVLIRQLPDKTFLVNGIKIPLGSKDYSKNDWITNQFILKNVDLIFQSANDEIFTLKNVDIQRNGNQANIRSTYLKVDAIKWLAKPLIFDDVQAHVFFSPNNIIGKDLIIKNAMLVLQGDMIFSLLDNNRIDLQLEYSLQALDKIPEYIPQLKPYSLSGNPITGKIAITGPLQQLTINNIKANALLKYINVSKDNQMWLQHLNGELLFPNLKTTELKAQLLNEPVNINIKKENNNVEVNVEGVLSIAELQKIPDFKFLEKIMQGRTHFNAQWKQSQNQTFYFSSDLEGLSILLPEPLRKSPQDVTPTDFNVVIADQQMKFVMNYAKKLSIALVSEKNAKNKWGLISGDIIFGGEKAVIPQNKNLTVHGHIPKLDIAQLPEYFLFQESSKQSFPLVHLDLIFDHLFIANFPLHKTTLLAKSSKNSWALQIKNSDIAGQISIPSDLQKKTIQMNFKRFYLSSKAILAFKKSSSQNLKIKPSQIPPLHVVINDFYYDNDEVGRIELLTTQHRHKFSMRKFIVKSPQADLTMTGRWEDDSGRSFICGHLTTSNFGDFLKDWNITESLEGGEGHLDFRLNWLGPIYEMNIPKLNGDLILSLSDGVILDIMNENMEMIGRILNFISIDTLEFLLAKPFNAIAPKSKGFDFEVEKVDLYIENGNLKTDDFYLSGKLAEVNANGRIGLAVQDYDLNVTITPFISAFLPMNAILSANPLAKGFIWISDQLIGSVFNRFLRQQYHVTGTWLHPVYQKVTD